MGNIGLYYVCYRLSCLGSNVMPTSRNAKGVDIIAYGKDGSCTRTLQVMALSKRHAVGLGKNPANLVAQYVVVCRFVQRKPPEQPECFVLTGEEARLLCHPSGQDGKISYWLEPLQYEAPKFLKQWNRLHEDKGED